MNKIVNSQRIINSLLLIFKQHLLVCINPQKSQVLHSHPFLRKSFFFWILKYIPYLQPSAVYDMRDLILNNEMQVFCRVSISNEDPICDLDRTYDVLIVYLQHLRVIG